MRGRRAERYVPARNATPSPFRFELELDAATWAELDDCELAVFHSHVEAAAHPSRTDVENIGLWQNTDYLIYSLAHDELAAFTISGSGVEGLAVTVERPGDVSLP